MITNRRVLIFANGVMDETEWLTGYMQPDDWLIAVDGGYQYLHGLGLKPDLLIGDLDSISPHLLLQLKETPVEIIQFPTNKDQTDLELALDAAVQRGFRKIRIIAALGGRLDQTLGNIFLLTAPSFKKMDVRIENGSMQAFLVRDQAVIEGKEGDLVSLIPINGPAEDICTRGLKYPLKNEFLFIEHTRGISNVMLGNKAEIFMGKGQLLCIHTRL